MPRSRGADVVGRDVGFGAVGADTHDGGSCAMRVVEIADAADAGQQECCDPCGLDDARDGLDPFQVGVRAETVHAARTRQPVAMGDFD
jgi:hypothetical protein